MHNTECKGPGDRSIVTTCMWSITSEQVETSAGWAGPMHRDGLIHKVQAEPCGHRVDWDACGRRVRGGGRQRERERGREGEKEGEEKEKWR